ncbi:hypothetical protein N7475_009969 [Penicillium sp. IBT 31633x]|nr:hypothetical protein N7475_009969 [Penicillium sp. IBT 31633x]
MPSLSIRSLQCPVPDFLNQLQAHFDTSEPGCAHGRHFVVVYLAPLSTPNVSVMAGAPMSTVSPLPLMNARGVQVSHPIVR